MKQCHLVEEGGVGAGRDTLRWERAPIFILACLLSCP